MDTNEILSKILEKLDSLTCKVDAIQEDISSIKEDSSITRNAVNTLLDWAEDVQIEVKIPLYKKAE